MKTHGQILLLESDKILAANIIHSLGRRGYRVDWQVELQAATNSVDECLPDIIILDLLLASRSGVEFLYELRSYPDWQNIPVIVFSDISDQDLGVGREGLERLGIAAFHYKPATSLGQLANSVDELLRPAVKV